MELWNFEIWVSYFVENNDHLLTITLDESYTRTERECAAITSSIQQFQIGENSEGKFLLGKAKNRLTGISDKSYLTAISLFIKEEQRHARTLKEFMDSQDIPAIRKHWVDHVFRRLRRPFNLEMSITVLITAEIIATVYYQALKSTTQSRHLFDICSQILRDDDKHIEFQFETIQRLLSNRSRLYCGIYRIGRSESSFYDQATVSVG